MTQTPNIGLKKIDGSENWRNVFDYHNDSMDLADEAIAGVRAGLTYVETGDTIAANANYTAGKFITWKGEIYRVKATINATVTSANWTTYLDKMDGIGGALSQINGDLASLNSNIEKYNNPDWYNSTDLDTLTTSGFYMIGQNNSHAPGTWGFLIVIAPRNDTRWQIFQSQYMLSIREYRNNAWGSWRNVSLQS